MQETRIKRDNQFKKTNLYSNLSSKSKFSFYIYIYYIFHAKFYPLIIHPISISKENDKSNSNVTNIKWNIE